MRLRIVHTTGYQYDGAAAASYNEARLTPLTAPGQVVEHTRLEITPAPWTYVYRDYFGTQVTAFEVLDPHESLQVTAVTTVVTDRRMMPGPRLSWAEMRSGQTAEARTEFLAVPPLVTPPPELAAKAAEIAGSSDTPGEAALALCGLVHDTLDYRLGSTDVLTSAAEAWHQGAGVCQDFAHVLVGALRTIGVPARYVSGYLHPGREAVPGEEVKGESHAWIEWWDREWVGFDATNAQPIGDRHVVIATGRDYGDVRPLSGIYSGGVASSMFVDVGVTRLS